MKLRECSLSGTRRSGFKSTFPNSFYYSYGISYSHYEKETSISIKITVMTIKTNINILKTVEKSLEYLFSCSPIATSYFIICIFLNIMNYELVYSFLLEQITPMYALRGYHKSGTAANDCFLLSNQHCLNNPASFFLCNNLIESLLFLKFSFSLLEERFIFSYHTPWYWYHSLRKMMCEWWYNALCGTEMTEFICKMPVSETRQFHLNNKSPGVNPRRPLSLQPRTIWNTLVPVSDVQVPPSKSLGWEIRKGSLNINSGSGSTYAPVFGYTPQYDG